MDLDPRGSRAADGSVNVAIAIRCKALSAENKVFSAEDFVVNDRRRMKSKATRVSVQLSFG